MKDGFYLGTVTEIEKSGDYYKAIFTVNVFGREYHPVLMLDLDIMDKQTAFFMILATGGCMNMWEELQYCIGKQMTILVDNFKVPKVLMVYPYKMFQILKRNEEGNLFNCTVERLNRLQYIHGGLVHSYAGKDNGLLYYESLFDDDFAEKLSEIKKSICSYTIPKDYYAVNSGPAFK